MKKILFFASLAAAATMTLGCSKDNIEGNDNVPGDGEVSYFEPQTIIKASSSATKTALSGLEILWEEGDVISLFNENGTPMNYSLTDGAGSTSGTFAADGEPKTGYSYAIYPVVSGQVSGTSVPVTVASAQTYLAGGFSAEYPMAAMTGDGMNFTFENLATVLSLSLQGDAVVRSVTVEAVGGEGLSGAATVDFSGEIPSLSATEGASASVTLDCGESGVALSADAATEFTFVVIPGEYSGLKVSVTDMNGHVTSRTTGAATMTAGTKKNFGSALNINSAPQGWNLTGSAYGWGSSWVDLYESHGLFSCKDINMAADEEFKILWAADWTDQAFGSDAGLSLNRGVGLVNGQANLKIEADGVYDIYFDQMTKFVFVMENGETPNLGIVGDINNWGNEGENGEAPEDDVKMTMENGYFVVKNITMPDGGFKIRLDNSWTNEYNIGPEEDTPVVIGEPLNVRNNVGGASRNMIVTAGTYDIWFDLGAMQVWVMTPGNTPSQN